MGGLSRPQGLCSAGDPTFCMMLAEMIEAAMTPPPILHFGLTGGGTRPDKSNDEQKTGKHHQRGRETEVLRNESN